MGRGIFLAKHFVFTNAKKPTKLSPLSRKSESLKIFNFLNLFPSILFLIDFSDIIYINLK